MFAIFLLKETGRLEISSKLGGYSYEIRFEKPTFNFKDKIRLDSYAYHAFSQLVAGVSKQDFLPVIDLRLNCDRFGDKIFY